MSDAVALAHRHFGGNSNPPLVVLPGFLGSSRNWSTAGRRLAERFEVTALDLRNHGASPHASGMDFATLAGDVVAWLDRHGLASVHLMGHSLGGKVAMRVACDQPGRVGLLYVLDIAPRRYEPDRAVLDAMAALDLGALGSRSDAQRGLAERIPDLATRFFVLTNLVRDDDGYRWQVDLEELRRAQPALAGSPLGPDEVYTGPTQFVIGGDSPYVTTDDRPLIARHFPAAEIATLPGSGHNVHTEKLEDFVAVVNRFADAADGLPSTPRPPAPP